MKRFQYETWEIDEEKKSGRKKSKDYRKKMIRIRVPKNIFVFGCIFLMNIAPLITHEKVEMNMMNDFTTLCNNWENQYIKSTYSFKLSYDQMNQIKNQFLYLEKHSQGIQKIQKQLQILKNLNILPEDFSVYTLLSLLYTTYQKNHSHFPMIKNIIGGPMIISHLTIGGRIKSLIKVNPTIYNSTNISCDSFLNGSYINRVYGILPIYVGAALRPVYITLIGHTILGKSHMFSFPFFEMLAPCAGFSVAFIYRTPHSHKLVVFEYNVDICFIGFLFGF